MKNVIESKNIEEIIERLKNGQVGVLPTDTIYGVHGLGNNEDILNRIYDIKHRPHDMPIIRLISHIDQLYEFNIDLSEHHLDILNKYWPGTNTFVLTLHNGGTMSFRLPDNEFLQSIVFKTGPIISTSANIHGKEHATIIDQAYAYFEDSVDFYVDGGHLKNNPSNVYLLDGDNIVKLR